MGLLIMTLVSIALAFIPEMFPPSFEDGRFFFSTPLPTFEQSLKIALAAFAGALVARVPFVLATIVYYVVVSLWTLHILTLIAAPVEPTTIADVMAPNAVGLGAGLIAAVIGADLGYRMTAARAKPQKS